MQKDFHFKLLMLILSILAFSVAIASSIWVKLTEITMAIFLLLISIGILLIYKFPKIKTKYTGIVFGTTIMFTIAYIIVTYIVGLFIGFTSNPLTFKIETIVKNIIPAIIIIISVEISRYILVEKSRKKPIFIILIASTFTIIDIILRISSFNFAVPLEIIKFAFVFLLPALSKNIFLTYITDKSHFSVSIIYRLITELLIYISPISPDLGLYMIGTLGMIIPMILIVLVKNITKIQKVVVYESSLASKVLTSVVILLSLCVIGLFSGLFKYQMLIIATGSMQPNINIGDAIVIKKLNKQQLYEIKVGDVLSFKKEGKIIVHRVVDIEKSSDKYKFTTKGDANNAVDIMPIPDEEVMGITDIKIPYIGLPTILLNQTFWWK